MGVTVNVIPTTIKLKAVTATFTDMSAESSDYPEPLRGPHSITPHAPPNPTDTKFSYRSL
jgi:hypothetical protein